MGETSLEKASLLIKEGGFDLVMEIIAHSFRIKKVIALIKNVAKTDFPVLLLKKTGVGKSLIGEIVHRESERNARLFVSLNIA